MLKRLLCKLGFHDKRMRYVSADGRPTGAKHFVIVCARKGCKHMEYGGPTTC